MKTLTKNKHNTNVLILKSNIKTKKDAKKVNEIFSQIKSIKRWSIDLDDWERILKVESFILSSENIAVILKQFGYKCTELNH